MARTGMDAQAYLTGSCGSSCKNGTGALKGCGVSLTHNRPGDSGIVNISKCWMSVLGVITLQRTASGPESRQIPHEGIRSFCSDLAVTEWLLEKTE